MRHAQPLSMLSSDRNADAARHRYSRSALARSAFVYTHAHRRSSARLFRRGSSLPSPPSAAVKRAVSSTRSNRMPRTELQPLCCTRSHCAHVLRTRWSEFSCGALLMTGVGDGVATRQQAPSCVATINVASYNQRCHRAHLSCRERVTLKILCLPHALLRRFDGAVAYSMVILSWCDSAESASRLGHSALG